MKEEALEGKMEVEVPPLFRCPISLDLLRDPVTLCTGQTYDRSSIEKWLASGKSTCPITMQKLHDPSFVPNHTLRHLIQDWLHHVSLTDLEMVKNKTAPNSSAREFDGHSLLLNLRSLSIPLDHKVEMLEEIIVLAEDLPLKNTALVQLDFINVILDLVFGSSVNSEMITSMRFAELGLVCALKLLPFSGLEPMNMLANQESKITSFQTLFELGSSVIKKSLCNLMEAMASSSSPETRKLCSLLGKSGRLLRQLNDTINACSEASSSATKAVLALSCLEQIREAMVREGAIDSLIKCVLENAQKCKTSSAPMAMRAIELLIETKTGKEAVLENPNGVKAMVKMVFRVSDHGGSESAVSCLVILCEDSFKARERAICNGVLTQVLLLLQSQCSGRIKIRARLLLKLLRR
ncbi:unnamed protein product [Cuscuta epithymum]|uniref:U-box domain-containing protein n=1 Tax=Cuscuta epithymum TaxID=186058 RepID=A0AAV0D879_9ASTE|nr:unnamed protein product [Cuscuta epithymum]